MAHIATASYPICPRCSEHVELESANTDEKGKAVHEECYVVYAIEQARIPIVKKPGLIITSSPQDEILAGRCSSCPSAQFRLRGNTLKNKEVLRSIFETHFKRVHMREFAGRPAMRLVGTVTH